MCFKICTIHSRCTRLRMPGFPNHPRGFLTTREDAPSLHPNIDDISLLAAHCHQLRWTSRVNISFKGSTYLVLTCGGGVAYKRLGTTTLGDTNITRDIGDWDLTGLANVTTVRAAFRMEEFFVHRESISQGILNRSAEKIPEQSNWTGLERK